MKSPTHRRSLLLAAIGGLLAGQVLPAARAAENPPSAHLGLQLWSLNSAFRQNVPASLDAVASFGFKLVETAGTYGVPVGEFAAGLRAHGLRAISAHFSYAELDGNLAAVIAQARTLGVESIVIPVIPHHPLRFTVADARIAAAKFNAWGEVIRANGMKLGYHTHGYEFQPSAMENGLTPFDVLVQNTRPDLVFLEMDVFWVAHAGVDPVALLAKYPGRWRMLHLKDLRTGAPRNHLGSAPPADDVPIGTGEIPWPAVFRAARSAGVVDYFIEDESGAPLQNIPISLRYLAAFDL
jgi:sugar phosphate isomerase/epimerase